MKLRPRSKTALRIVNADAKPWESRVGNTVMAGFLFYFSNKIRHRGQGTCASVQSRDSDAKPCHLGVVIDANYSIQLLCGGNPLQCDTTSHRPLLIPGLLLFQHGIQTCSTRSGWSPWLQLGTRGLGRSLILHLASSCNDAKWTWIAALARTTILVLL